jgi:hypothetical protein
LDSTLPVAQSITVVVGERLIYLKIKQTCIQSSPCVRLPNGRISGYYVSGQNPPQVGRRYVLFLGFNKCDASNRRLTARREMSRHILTGYEFKEGKVFPLDSAGGKNFQEHSGKDASAFLDEIRRAVTSSSEVMPE